MRGCVDNNIDALAICSSKNRIDSAVGLGVDGEISTK